ncbi:MAG: PAS domain-containing protein [Gammaproteobacteria bacterium]|nr:PAS domain-containing protein [Gammaproteobacteria bacterium]
MSVNSDKILDTLNSAIMCLDACGTVVYVNFPGEILFDCSAVALIGKPFEDLLSSVEPNNIIEKIRCFDQSKQTLTEREAQLRLSDGRSKLVDYSIYALDNDSNTAVILVEIRPLERQLEITQDALNNLQKQVSQQFARGIAHEIKNPLGGIRGAAQLLDRELSDPALKEYTEVIIGEVDRLQVLIDNMLGPASHLEKNPVNILEILEHIRKLLETAEPHSFEFRRDYDPSIPEFNADRNLLIQAFLNLALNAVQALVDNGLIIFKTRIERNITINKIMHPLVMLIDIIDNGKGIPENINNTLFLPMVTDKAEGSGLGLPIAQQIISRHGGIIKVESCSEGTIFRTMLPLELA